ncbi:MAG: acetyl-CoA C-acetyltransferase [Acidobacteriota bacterium]
MAMPSEAVIISAVRTPIGRFQGALKPLSAPQLGARAIEGALARTSLRPEQIDEVLMGCVLQAGLGQNPARQAALGARLSVTVSALTVNMVCGSGLRSVMLAAQSILTGDRDFVVAGGMESMSNAPYLLARARDGYRMGHDRILDAMIVDGLWCAFDDWHMGETGEVVAAAGGISRERQDRFALESQQRAIAAQRARLFDQELHPVKNRERQGGEKLVDTDEGPRPEVTLESLAALRPAFRPDGTVTAGNASTINDGAAAVIVTSAALAERTGHQPLARIVAQATAGVEPRMVMMAPVEAVRLVAQKAGWGLDEVDRFEFNEAFAAQAVALLDVLGPDGLDPQRVNVNGGAIALGHPIGASGTRVLVTLLHELMRSGTRRGIAALCLGGGNAVALAVERP